MMMKQSTLSASILRLTTGPLIWFAHFSALYVTATLACRHSFAPSPWFLAATVLAIVLLVANAWKARLPPAFDAAATRWGQALNLLSGLGVCWTMLAALLAPGGC